MGGKVMSTMLCVLSSLEGQACVRAFKDIPTRTDVSNMKEEKKLSQAPFLHISPIYYFHCEDFRKEF